MERPLISIVVPARDEPSITAFEASLRSRFPEAETIVVDTAGRPELTTRAQAMNDGARNAKGSILLFLHADCELPDGADREIARAIERGALGGGFAKRYDPTNPLLRLQAWWLNRLPVLDGANALFVRKEAFDAWGGYPDWPLFEDVWLADKFEATGRTAVLRTPVTVSSRKYRAWMGVPRILRNATLYTLYRIGFPVRILAALY